jgi:hypothetical protein
MVKMAKLVYFLKRIKWMYGVHQAHPFNLSESRETFVILTFLSAYYTG